MTPFAKAASSGMARCAVPNTWLPCGSLTRMATRRAICDGSSWYAPRPQPSVSIMRRLQSCTTEAGKSANLSA